MTPEPAARSGSWRGPRRSKNSGPKNSRKRCSVSGEGVPSAEADFLALTLTLTTDGVARSATETKAFSRIWRMALGSGAAAGAWAACACAGAGAQTSAGASNVIEHSRYRNGRMVSSWRAILPPGRGDHQRHGECHLEDTPRVGSYGRRLASTESGDPDEVAVCLEERHPRTLPARHAGIDQEGLEPSLLRAAPGQEAIASSPGPHGEARGNPVCFEDDRARRAWHDIAGAGLEASRLQGRADLGQRQGARHGEIARLEIGQAASPYPEPLPALLDDETAGADETPRDIRSQEAPERALSGAAHGPGMPEAQGGRAQRLGGDLVRESPQIGDGEDPARAAATAQAGQLARARALEVVDEGAHERRRAGEPGRDAGIHRALEEGQHVVADAIAQKTRIPIARILHPGQAARPEMGFDVGPARLEQRPDQEAADRRDPGKPARARALEEPHEHRLRLVVGGMRGGDALGAHALGHGSKSAVSSAPGLGLETFPGRLPTHRNPLDVAGHMKIGGQTLHGGLLGIGLGAEPVVHVDEMDGHVELAGEAREHVGQRDGIGAARDGGQDSFAAPEHSGAANGGASNLDETTVARGYRPLVDLPRPRRPRSTPSSTQAPSS